MALPGITSSTRGAATRPTEPAPAASDDWPVQATDAIVKVVDNVRDKTTGPVLNATRWVIYGLVMGVLALPMVVIVLIGAMRGAEGILLFIGEKTGWAWLHDPIWIVYLGFGAVFTLVGLWLWRKADRAVTLA